MGKRKLRKSQKWPISKGIPARSRRGLPIFGIHGMFLPILVLLAAGTWAYTTSMAGVFIFDDSLAIVDNPHIRKLWPLRESMSAPEGSTLSGRPIVSLTFAINHVLAPADVNDIMRPEGSGMSFDPADPFYENIWGYHVLNLVIHLMASLVLFGIVRRSLCSKPLQERFGGAATLLAFCVALIWVLHPLHTGSVTYIVQRVESLAGLFYLLTLYCAIRAAESGSHNGWWMGASIATCALGMGSKEVMVTAPMIVWLWDVVFLGGHPSKRWRLYAGLGATWVIMAGMLASSAESRAILQLLASTETRAHSLDFGLGWTRWTYLCTQASVVVHYLKLAVVPVPLVFNYYDWPQMRSLAAVAPQAASLAVLVALSAVALVRRQPLGFVGAWFFVILAPTSSVAPIPTEVAAEHRMYLPLAAVIVLVVLCAYALSRRVLTLIASKEKSNSPFRLVIGLLFVCGVAATFAGLTHGRNRDYWSDQRLWLDTVQKRPRNVLARINYGIDLMKEQRYSESEAQMRIAATLETDRKTKAQVLLQLGSALCAQRKFTEGIPDLKQALSLEPTLSEAYVILGQSYSDQGNLAMAMTYFEKAVELMPDSPPLLSRVAWLLATSPDDHVRNGKRAVDMAERAVRLTGGLDVSALNALAAAYAEADRFAEAAATVRNALTVARVQRNESAIAQLERDLTIYESHRKMRAG